MFDTPPNGHYDITHVFTIGIEERRFNTAGFAFPPPPRHYFSYGEHAATHCFATCH